MIKEQIDDIRNRLKNKEYPNEQAVRQGIVDPLLRNLGWPLEETQIAYPEYTVGSGKVDYALLDPQSKKPRVFIEAKQVGNIEGAEEQLFGYDARIRVPIAVLTDGQIWRFFHPTGEGTWEERKIRELDFITGDSAESAECLSKYLNYESICSDKAVDAIRDDYNNRVRQKKIQSGLPEAWRALVKEADKGLIKVVVEKTENVCGHRPDDEQVIAFLRKEELPLVQPLAPDPREKQPVQPNAPTPRKKSTRLRVTMPNGEVVERRHAKATFIETLEKLGIEKVMSVHPSTVRTDPPKYFRVEYGQYYIHHYADTRGKKRALEEIAQLLGVQITVEIVEK
ncbi:MAG: type I restriction enzyme HsdR N-terminal domain-containing protein [Candidatus Poribacteria bacterium]|nr:type I restriction enzyme HsdR N-terminal domain-containing protein [Candidatus Poribacteria bacterium]